MSEEFFERLREEARAQLEIVPELYNRRLMWTADLEAGINATIEALKEMMVGEPIRAIIEHEFHQDSTKAEMDEDTMIVAHPFKFGCDAEIWFRDHHGTDGGEVIVLAVRLS